MKRVLIYAGLLGSVATGAVAGGIDRSGQGVGILWEKGEAVTLSFGYVTPSITSANPLAAGDVGENFLQFSLAYKRPLTDSLSAALILDQPFGAGITYRAGPLVGTSAKLKTQAVTGILQYKTPQNFSVYGGLRIQSLSGEANVPRAGAYTLTTDTDIGVGYLAGVAYERPDIALRVALTYNSAIDHNLQGTEFTLAPIPGGPVTPFDNTTPQSVNLDFQTGVAPGTLVFGSIRWADWSEYDVTPGRYPGGSLVDYNLDVTTYTLGVGRKFNDKWSGALSLAYEAPDGEPAPNLGPVDGYRAISVAAIYNMDEQTKITAGLRYVDIGDTTSRAGIAFNGSDALGIGISMTHSF